MAGTIYYLDIDNGSPSNNGLTPATAKRLPEDLIGIVTNLDVIKQRASVNPYVWTQATAGNQTFFGSLNLLWTNWDTDGMQMPTNLILKNLGNYYQIISGTSLIFYRVKFKFDYSGQSNTTIPLSFSSSGTAVVRFYNCELELYKIDNPATQHVASMTGGSGSCNIYNTKIWNSGSLNNVFSLTMGSTGTSVCFNSKIYGFVASSFAPTQSSCNRFCFNKVMIGLQGSNTFFVNSAPAGLGRTFTNNSIVIMSLGSITGTIKFWRFLAGPYAANTYDNIFCNLSGGTVYGIAGDSAITQQPYEDAAVGNNLFINCTATNVTNLVESYGASSYASDSYPGPFLSLDINSPNFLETDPTDANVIAFAKGKGLISPNMSIGFTQINSADLPAIADVRSGTIYDNGNKTGTLNLPATSDVKVGVSYDGATKTGTYDGSDRWTNPGQANVRSGTAYKANSTTNNQTGTLNLPATTDVKTGVTYDGATKTGTYDGSDRWSNPGQANVRSGTAYKANSTTNNQTGTLDLPTEANTKVGVLYDNNSKTGTYTGSDRFTVPAEAEVKVGVSFKDNNVNKTGTYTGADRFTVPAENQVKVGVNFKDNNVNKTGSYDGSDRFSVPAPADVREGVGFIDNTVSKTGLLHLPVTDAILNSELKVGVTKTVNDVSVTGTYDGSERFTVPAEADVREGVSFKNNTVNKLGSLHLPVSTDPGEDNVLAGVEYMINDEEKIGNVSLPAESDVKLGVHFGSNGELEGTAEVGSLSTDPGPGNVLKGVQYEINGEAKVGQYDTGHTDITPGVGNIRIKVLKKLEDVLYGVSPDKNAKYQNVIRSVSYEASHKLGLTQDDFPHVQVFAEENQYDHAFVLSGNMAEVTMKCRLIITTPSNWNALDAESLYEDIRQAFIYDNYSLDGLVMSTKVESFAPMSGDADKEDNNRKAVMVMVFKFIEVIEQ